MIEFDNRDCPGVERVDQVRSGKSDGGGRHHPGHHRRPLLRVGRSKSRRHACVSSGGLTGSGSARSLAGGAVWGVPGRGSSPAALRRRTPSCRHSCPSAIFGPAVVGSPVYRGAHHREVAAGGSPPFIRPRSPGGGRQAAIRSQVDDGLPAGLPAINEANTVPSPSGATSTGTGSPARAPRHRPATHLPRGSAAAVSGGGGFATV